MTGRRALVDITERLAATGAGAPPVVIGEPVGAAWWGLGEATARAEAWFPPLVEQVGDRRAAASYLSGWLAEGPLLVIGLCVVLGEVAPRLTSDRLWLHRHRDGWFDRHAIDPVDAFTGAGNDVLAAGGEHVAELTAPVVDHVCASLPVGPAAVWGTVADALGGSALWLSRELGRDEVETWRRCEALIDEVQRHAPMLRHRPRLFPVAWSGGITHYQVRGTCCLHHRTCGHPEPDGEGYCTTCPLRSDDSRTRRLRRHLEPAELDTDPVI